jgi:hypothetical protein
VIGYYSILAFYLFSIISKWKNTFIISAKQLNEKWPWLSSLTGFHIRLYCSEFDTFIRLSVGSVRRLIAKSIIWYKYMYTAQHVLSVTVSSKMSCIKGTRIKVSSVSFKLQSKQTHIYTNTFTILMYRLLSFV